MKKEDIIQAFQDDTLDDLITEHNSIKIAKTIFIFMLGAIAGMFTLYLIL